MAWIFWISIAIWVIAHLVVIAKFELPGALIIFGVLHGISLAIRYFFDLGWGWTYALDFGLTFFAMLQAFKSEGGGGGGGDFATDLGISALGGYLLGKGLGKL